MDTLCHITGACAIVGAGFGTWLGGYLTKRWKLKVLGMIKFGVCTVFVTLVVLFGLLVRCSQELLVGVNVDYNGNLYVKFVDCFISFCSEMVI